MQTQKEIDKAAKKEQDDKLAAAAAAAAAGIQGQNLSQPPILPTEDLPEPEELSGQPSLTIQQPNATLPEPIPTNAPAKTTTDTPQTSSTKTSSSTSTPNSSHSPPHLTGGTPPGYSSKKPPGFVKKLFNVGDDGIMGMIKNLFQPEWLKKKREDPKSNKIVLGALLALNAVPAGLASAVLIGVGAVTAGILKGTYDVFDGVSSIIAEGIVWATKTPLTSPFKPPHSEKFKEAGKTVAKGLAKFIVGSAIVAGIAMGGAGIAGVGVAAMLPVLVTIGKVISIGMLSLSSSAGLGLSIWVINKVAKRQQEEVESKEKPREITVNTNRAPNLKKSNSYIEKLKSLTKKNFPKSSDINFSEIHKEDPKMDSPKKVKITIGSDKSTFKP